MSQFPRRGVLLASALLTLPAPVAGDIFVGAGDKILSFYNFDSNDATPHREISGNLTGLSSVTSLALDRDHRELWVVDNGNTLVSVFSMDADGNFAPLRQITATALASPHCVLVDLVHDEVYVVDFDANAVFVFPRTQNGNAAPVRTLSGALTGISGPVQGFLDLVHDELYVVNYVGVEARVGVFDRATASGDVAPIRVLGGAGNAGSGINNPRGLFVDLQTDLLVVAEYDLDALRLYSRTASGATPFLNEIAGNLTALDAPFDLVVDTFGELIVGADAAVNPRVVVHVAVPGNQPPDRVIVGPSTGLSGPTGIASDYARDCSWGNSVDGCIFRDNFESGELCYWNPVVGGPGCT